MGKDAKHRTAVSSMVFQVNNGNNYEQLFLCYALIFGAKVKGSGLIIMASYP